MKKLISGLVITGLLSTCMLAYAETASWTAQKATFKVLVRGKEYTSETPPIVIDGRTFLPLRAMGDVLGVPVDWNTKLNQAEVGMSTAKTSDTAAQTVLSDSEKVIWKKGSWKASKATFKVFVRGNEFVSENPPIVVEGRTFLPLRVLGEALGIKIDWNEKLKQAEVDMGTVTEPTTTPAPRVPATTPTATATVTATPSATTTPTATSKKSDHTSASTSTPAPATTSTATPTPAATSKSTPASSSNSESTPAPAATSKSTPAPASNSESTPAPASNSPSNQDQAATPNPAGTSDSSDDWYKHSDGSSDDWYKHSDGSSDDDSELTPDGSSDDDSELTPAN